MIHAGKVRALLATARVANTPSVVSNLWCGYAIAHAARHEWQFDGFTFIRLSVAGIFLYVAGNFLNDWMDREWDAQHRPERALPRGLYHPVSYVQIAILLAVNGLAITASIQPRAVWIAAVILMFVSIYTWIHKRTPWSVVPMGLCRAGLPVMGAVAALPIGAGLQASALPSTALFVYICSLSVIARKSKSGRLVSLMLAGIPLVDMWFMLPLGIAHYPSPVGIVSLILPPAAVVAGRLLQRLAPAT